LDKTKPYGIEVLRNLLYGTENALIQHGNPFEVVDKPPYPVERDRGALWQSSEICASSS
jgi:hypothetical protein